MKKQFSIFLLIFFVSANINAEISGVSILDLTQLYKEQIVKILVGNKLFGHYDDGDYQGTVEEIHYKNGEIQVTDALLSQAKKGKVIACKFKGKRFDCGSVKGYLKATNHFAKAQGINNI